MAICDESERGFRFVDFILIEADRLIKSVGAGWLEAGSLELLDCVSLCFAQTFAASVAAFERIVREKLNMRPPRVPVKVGSWRSLLRWRNNRTGREKNCISHATP